MLVFFSLKAKKCGKLYPKEVYKIYTWFLYWQYNANRTFHTAYTTYASTNFENYSLNGKKKIIFKIHDVFLHYVYKLLNDKLIFRKST
jgi:hypothetical protein